MTMSLVWMKVNVWAMLQTDLGKPNMPDLFTETHRCSNQNMYMHNVQHTHTLHTLYISPSQPIDFFFTLDTHRCSSYAVINVTHHRSAGMLSSR